MAITVPSAQPRQILPQRSDFERNYARTEETLAAAHLDAERRDVRYYHRNRGHSVAAVYAMLRKWINGGAEVVTLPQIVEDTGLSKNTVRRCLRVLEQEGLIATSLATYEGGKNKGLKVKLLTVPEPVLRRSSQLSYIRANQGL